MGREEREEIDLSVHEAEQLLLSSCGFPRRILHFRLPVASASGERSVYMIRISVLFESRKEGGVRTIDQIFSILTVGQLRAADGLRKKWSLG